MLNVLLESAAPAPRPHPATVFSVVIHTALIVVFLAEGQGRQPEMDGGERENVRYLIPLDRVKAPPPLEVRTHWQGEGLIGEGAGSDAGLRVSDALTGRAPVSGRSLVSNSTTATEALDVVYDTVASAIDVDSVARVVESAAPAYPAALLAQNVEGKAVVQFVVDTLGLVDSLSFAVIEATHAQFAEAVRAVLPAMRFTPAIMSSRKVKQLVQQPFLFKIVPPTRAVARADSAS